MSGLEPQFQSLEDSRESLGLVPGGIETVLSGYREASWNSSPASQNRLSDYSEQSPEPQMASMHVERLSVGSNAQELRSVSLAATLELNPKGNNGIRDDINVSGLVEALSPSKLQFEESPEQRDGCLQSGAERKFSNLRKLPRRKSPEEDDDDIPYGDWDPTSGERNNVENFPGSKSQEWRDHRDEVLSELQFKVSVFLTTFVVELFPTSIGRFISWAIEGRTKAINRDLFRNPLYDLFAPQAPQAPVLVNMIVALLFVNDLPADAPYAVLSLCLFIAGRAAITGIKYGLYGDLQLSNQVRNGFGTASYKESELMLRNQIVVFVFNDGDRQGFELIRSLYKSCLYQDVDLSCAFFEMPDSQTRRREICNQDHDRDLRYAHGAIGATSPIEIWEEVKEKLTHLDNTFGEEVHQSTHEKDVGTFSSFRAPSASSKARSDPEDEVEYSLLSCDKHFLHWFLRESVEEINERTSRGQVPATIMAIKLVLNTMYTPPKQGATHVITMIFIALVIAFIPAVSRVCLGQTAFGETWKEKLYHGTAVFPTWITFFLFIAYSYAPTLHTYRKLRLTKLLLELIAGDNLFGVMGIVWSTDINRVFRSSAPVLDLRIPSNVTAWAVCRRVLHGQGYGPVQNIKFQMYSVVCFVVYFTTAAVESLGGYFAARSAEGYSTDAKIASMCKLIVFACPLIAQVLLAYQVNRYTSHHSEALARAMTTNRTLAAALKHTKDKKFEEKMEELVEANEVFKLPFFCLGPVSLERAAWRPFSALMRPLSV